MTRNTKKKLAIFAGTSKCLVYAEAKHCVSEIPGEMEYYECSRTEYCCPFGCCVSPGLHFHHLWYYWILVIIMFLVCSGGGWWYRYWLQGRYRAAASAIPNRSSNSRAQSSLRGSSCQAQQARITYNSARNTVLLHRMWKGPQRNGMSSSYNGTATTSTHYQNMNVVLNDANCPYYQLYGPPPSYETVIAQSRGKASAPASPEPSGARANVQTGNAITNASVPQCFAYPCSPVRLNVPLDQGVQCQNAGLSSRQTEDRHDNVPFVHFPQYCASDAPLIRQTLCVPPYEYPEQSVAPIDAFVRPYHASPSRYAPPYGVDKPSDMSDTETVAHSYEMPSVDRYPTTLDRTAHDSRRDQGSWDEVDRPTSQLHGKGSVGVGGGKHATKHRALLQETREIAPEVALPSSSNCNEANASDEQQRDPVYGLGLKLLLTQRCSRTDSPEDVAMARSRRLLDASLRSTTGRYARYEEDTASARQRAVVKDSLGSHDGIFQSSRTAVSESPPRNVVPSECLATVADTSPSESNPSNNVILGSFAFREASTTKDCAANKAGGYSGASRANANSDLESKHKLDRSKSLD